MRPILNMQEEFVWKKFQYFTTVSNVFKKDHCELLIKQRELKQKHHSVLGQAENPARDSNCYFFTKNENPNMDTAMMVLLHYVNLYNKDYNFEITKGLPFVQLTEYTPNQYYHTHMDLGQGDASLRKITIVVQLSDPSTHDGGISFCYDIDKIHQVRLNQGDAVIFPSFIQHKADKVTYGTRHSLVGWVLGAAPFK